MNVLLVDIDSRIPNLALKKLEAYHSQRGDLVQWGNMPLWVSWADRIYVSCVFTWNREKCDEWEMEKAVIGGTGYDVKTKLPDEIEVVKPHINLGFTTRGCIRHCDFCVVPEKEGQIRVVGDLLDLWDGKGRLVTVLDNNILAVPGHFHLVCRQAQEKNLIVDFNQGLDHRLLTDSIVSELRRTRHRGEYRFAFDHPDMIDSVKKALALLHWHGINRSFWYVLVGYNTTLEEDLFRLNFLRSQGQTAFVQRFEKDPGNLSLARWANQHHIFRKMSYEEFLNCSA
jgi:hypothetical protein